MFIQIILIPQVEVTDIIIDVSERSSARSVPQSVSTNPQRKYVGMIMEYLVIAAENATLSSEIYKLSNGLWNTIISPPIIQPIAKTTPTE